MKLPQYEKTFNKEPNIDQLSDSSFEENAHIMLKKDFQVFHITVKALIIHKGELLLLKSSEKDRPNDLEPPGGRVDQDESLKETLKRELREEIDLDLDKIKHQINFFDINQRNKEEYGWDTFTTILEIYYLITIPDEIEFSVYPKTESNGLVYINKDSNLNDYTYTIKGRREIFEKIKKLF